MEGIGGTGFGRYVIHSCCHWCRFGSVYVAKICSVAGVILSIMTLMGCMLFHIQCQNDNDEECFYEDNNLSYSPRHNYGLFTYDVTPTELKDNDGNDIIIPGGACVFYTYDTSPSWLSDNSVMVSRAMAITGCCCGIITMCSLFAFNVLFGNNNNNNNNRFHLGFTCTMSLASCVFQSLTFLITQSSAWSNGSNATTTTRMNRTSYTCIGSSICYFISMIYCTIALHVSWDRNVNDEYNNIMKRSFKKQNDNKHSNNNNCGEAIDATSSKAYGDMVSDLGSPKCE